MSAPLQVQLNLVGGAVFEACHPSGERIRLEGPPDLGGTDQYFRPMETVLVSLAGCAAIDILHISQKARKKLAQLEVRVSATRANAVPAVFETIQIQFRAAGDFDETWLQRAADLSMDKYCSVARMLAPTVKIVHEIERIGDSE